MDAFHRQRRFALKTWRPGERGELVGEGKYGQVYRCGPGAVAKDLDVARRSRREQAYREHVVGLLQTLLVLSRVTPHLPLHYGALWGQRRMELHMEAFDVSLDRAGACLVDEEAWVSLFFQVWSALLALAFVFGVAHNDLYPRNVLLRAAPATAPVCYEVLGRRYKVPLPFFAALTDFGVASCPWGGEHAVRPSPLGAPPDLGSLPPSRHVLQYDLPVFARDPYSLLKWAAFPNRSLPTAPSKVVGWARAGLTRLDERREDCRDADGAARLFAAAFDALRRHGLPELRTEDALPLFALRAEAVMSLPPMAAAALRVDDAEERRR